MAQANGLKNGCAGIIAVSVLIGIGLAFCAPSNEQKQTNKSADKPDLNNLLTNKTFISENPHYSEAIQTLIKERGYECPAITLLELQPDPTPDGPQLEVLCTYSKLHYAVYPNKFLVKVCSEFGMSFDSCS